MAETATTSTGKTRTEWIAQAILDELRRRRATIDASTELVSIGITIKLQDAPDPIRSVVYEDQSIRAKRR